MVDRADAVTRGDSMIRLMTLSICFWVSIASASRADVSVPLSWYEKHVDPKLRFEGIEDHGDYVFYLRFFNYHGNPKFGRHYFVEVKNSDAFGLGNYRRLSDLSILALKRSEFERRSADDPSLQWLTNKTAGVLYAPLSMPGGVGTMLDSDTSVKAYRVTLASGELMVEDVTPANWTRLSVGLCAAISLIALGIWFARRRRRSNQVEAGAKAG